MPFQVHSCGRVYSHTLVAESILSSYYQGYLEFRNSMPVTTRPRSRFLTMFTDPNPDPTGADAPTAALAQTGTATTPPSPLDRLLVHFETLLSHIQNSTPTTYSSRPGPNMEAGRNDSGRRLGLTQGLRASPIVRASSPGKPGDDVSHYPEFPVPETARSTVLSTSMLDPGLSALNSSSPDSNQYSTPSYNSPTPIHSNMFRDIRVPLYRDHSPHGRATVPVSNITSRDGVSNDLFTPRDGPCDLDINPQGNRCRNFEPANAESTDVMSNIPSTSFPPLTAISKHKWPTFNGATEDFLKWKAQFLAVLCSSELAPLYDASVDNLIMPSTRADVITYDIQLYSRIIAALPSSNSFIVSAEYRSKGLALWHALGQEHESTGSTPDSTTCCPFFTPHLCHGPTLKLSMHIGTGTFHWSVRSHLIQMLHLFLGTTSVRSSSLRWAMGLITSVKMLIITYPIHLF